MKKAILLGVPLVIYNEDNYDYRVETYKIDKKASSNISQVWVKDKVVSVKDIKYVKIVVSRNQLRYITQLKKKVLKRNKSWFKIKKKKYDNLFQSYRYEIWIKFDVYRKLFRKKELDICLANTENDLNGKNIIMRELYYMLNTQINFYWQVKFYDKKKNLLYYGLPRVIVEDIE